MNLSTLLHSLVVVVCCLTVWSASSLALAEDPPDNLPPLPWHLADVWWNFDAPTDDFQSLSIDFSVDRDIPSSHNLYIAPVGLGQLNNIRFYGGVQTNINGYLHGEDRQRRHPGKGAIFSRWGRQTLSYDFIRKAADGLVESAGYEGDFASVRRPLVWSKGDYTYSLVKGDHEQEDGKDFTWMTVVLTDRQNGQTTYVGSLRFEGKDFTYWDQHSAFVELYATSRIHRQEVPSVVVTFGYPRINGNMPKLKAATAVHPARGGGSSPDCAVITGSGSDVVVTVGDFFERDEAQRRHKIPLEQPAESGT